MHFSLSFASHSELCPCTGPGLHNPEPDFFGIVTLPPGEESEAPETHKVPKAKLPKIK